MSDCSWLSFEEKSINTIMKYSLVLFILLITGSAITAQEEDVIRVHHGRNGSTGILISENGPLTIKKSIQLVREKGTKLTLEVSNAHEALYKYTLASDTFSIDYGLPNFGELVGFFNNLLAPEGSKALEDPSDILKKLQGTGYLPFALTEMDKNLLTERDKEDELRKSLNELKFRLESVYRLVKNTDQPESLYETWEYSSLSEYGIRSNIMAFQLDELLTKLGEKKEEISELINSLYKEGSLDRDIRITYLNSIITQLEKVKNDYKKLSSPYVFKEEIEVGDKPEKYYLSISNLSKTIKGRDIGEQLIEVEVIPYEINRVEIVPVISLNYTDGLSSFEIRNGVISESEEDGFSFKPGLLLAVNAFYFGKYKEFSFGPSLGYSLDSEQQFLQNFNVGLLFSFQQKIRIGFGWGMQQHRSALTDKSLLGAPLPQDQTIDDVTKRIGRSTFSINFSLVGLSIFNK